LYNNSLTGTIPDLERSSLKRLQLHFNALTGSIPNGLYGNTDLEEIRLDSNQLTGTLATSIGNLLRLKDLRLDENAFFGSLPAEVLRLNTLGKQAPDCAGGATLVGDSSVPQPPCSLLA
jgi:Leucine-rich repeat (LRR) protein